MLDSTEEPVAEIVYIGEWRIEPTESHETVTFALRYRPSASNQSGATALANLGLTAEALVGPRHPLHFEVRREAGTFVCQGTASDGRGNGAFRFKPDPAYAIAIAETGLPALTVREHIKAGMFNVGTSFVKAIVATGLPHITFSELIGLKIFRVTPEAVNALHVSFPSAGLDDIRALAMMGVTPEDVGVLHVHFPSAGLDDIRALAMTGVTAGYVQALVRANIRHLSVDNVAALRATGIDQAFVEGLAAKGHRGLSIDEIVRLYSNGP